MNITKMKARDIISDWPRGTSTSKPWPSFPTVAAIGMYWSPRDVAMLEDEVESDRRYHEAQNRMMDDWHRARGATSELAHRLFVGELSRPDPLNFEPTFAMLYPSRVMFKLEGFKQ